MNIRKVDRADADLTEQVKVRLTPEQYEELRKVAMISNTYASTVARKAIIKYLKDLGL